MVTFTFEREFDPKPARQWMSKYWTISIVASVLYVVFLFGCKRVMAHRAPFSLQMPLILWNTFLAVFSIIGTIRVWPEFISFLKTEGFKASYCSISEESYYSGTNGFWVWLFVLSKLFELGDSVFVVLRKKPLIFLHWYHHAGTVIYLWYQYQFDVGGARWGTMMNYFVHSLMYSYYALKAANVKVPVRISMCITGLQLFQMFFGTYVCIKTFAISFLELEGPEHAKSCYTPKSCVLWQLAMYVSYLLLFANFFYRAYIVKRGSSQRKVAFKEA
jgi:elongation of very long chain fatty acids protein 6